jgi:hypothetical protein
LLGTCIVVLPLSYPCSRDPLACLLSVFPLIHVLVPMVFSVTLSNKMCITMCYTNTNLRMKKEYTIFSSFFLFIIHPLRRRIPVAKRGCYYSPRRTSSARALSTLGTAPILCMTYACRHVTTIRATVGLFRCIPNLVPPSCTEVRAF